MVFGFIVLALLVALVGFVLYQARLTRTYAAKAEAAVPPLGQFLDLSTGRLHYTDQGSGQPIILIHGLGGQLRSMTMGLADTLSSEFRVIAIDRPGMGYSDRPESASARIDDQAGYVEEVIDALNLDRLIVMGHSLGGAIAAALALRAPNKVGALALIAPLLRPSRQSSSAFSALAITKPGLRRFVANTIAIPTSAKNSAVTRDEIFGPEPIPSGYTTTGGGLLSLRPKSFVNTSRDYVAVPQVIGGQSKRYDEITCPVRVLYGTEDRILDHKEQGIGMAERYPHFRLDLIEGAGHMLPLTQAAAVVNVVKSLAHEL